MRAGRDVDDERRTADCTHDRGDDGADAHRDAGESCEQEYRTDAGSNRRAKGWCVTARFGADKVRGCSESVDGVAFGFLACQATFNSLIRGVPQVCFGLSQEAACLPSGRCGGSDEHGIKERFDRTDVQCIG